MRTPIWPVRQGGPTPYLDDDLPESLAAWLAGGELDPALIALANTPATHAAPPPTGPWVPDRATLARIAADIFPDAGVEGPHRLLGPHALTLPPGHPALLVGLAEAAMSPHRRDHPAPVIRWTRRKPLPTVEERASLRAIRRAPMALWRLVRQVGGAWELSDATGLSAPLCPDEPVSLAPVAPLGGRLVAGGWLLARVARGASGWVAPAPLSVAEPAAGAVDRAVLAATVAHRVHEPGVPVESCLAAQGALFGRLVLGGPHPSSKKRIPQVTSSPTTKPESSHGRSGRTS